MKKHIDQKDFSEKVRNIVRSIPKGKVLTYGEVARRAGSPKAARAVGTLMKGNYAVDIPCHRVVRSDGIVGEYNRGGSAAKVRLLKKEGVVFDGARVVVQKQK